MGGNPWNDVVQGAKKMIEYFNTDPDSTKDVKIIIIFFNCYARLIID